MTSSNKRIDDMVRTGILAKTSDPFYARMMLDRIQLFSNKWFATDVRSVKVRMSRKGWISSVVIEMLACVPDYCALTSVAGTYEIKFDGRQFSTKVSWAHAA